MSESVLDPTYYGKRLAEAKELHHAVFKCPLDRWLRIEAKHKIILSRLIGPEQSVLDVGCGYGRLVDMLHEDVDYVGVDLSPELIDLAKTKHPSKLFVCHDMRQPLYFGTFDWAVMISVKHTVLRNCGNEPWDKMELQIRRVANKLLFLEYDELDEGVVE